MDVPLPGKAVVGSGRPARSAKVGYRSTASAKAPANTNQPPRYNVILEVKLGEGCLCGYGSAGQRSPRAAAPG